MPEASLYVLALVYFAYVHIKLLEVAVIINGAFAELKLFFERALLVGIAS